FRVEVESKFHCKETGIKFVVESKTTIEYSLEYESDYVTWVQDNGYELLGPIFNVQVRSGQVSAVHLPHYVQLEGIKDKSMIKIGHFKDKKVTLKIPTKIEPNYVLLKDPSFSCIAVVGEHSTSIWRKKKPTPFHGKVRLYFRVLCAEMEEMEYRIHLYLLPADVPQLPVTLTESSYNAENVKKKNVRLRAKTQGHFSRAYGLVRDSPDLNSGARPELGGQVRRPDTETYRVSLKIRQTKLISYIQHQNQAHINTAPEPSSYHK
ncbi:LRR and PYD domains-containing protein 1-like, partial [Pristimantis euphronides]